MSPLDAAEDDFCPFEPKGDCALLLVAADHDDFPASPMPRIAQICQEIGIVVDAGLRHDGNVVVSFASKTEAAMFRLFWEDGDWRCVSKVADAPLT